MRAAEQTAATAGDDRDRASALSALGDVQVAQGALPAALASYQASLAICERLAKADPTSAAAQRDLIISYVKLQEATSDATYAQRALDVALAMQANGILAPSDQWMIPELHRLAGR